MIKQRYRDDFNVEDIRDLYSLFLTPEQWYPEKVCCGLNYSARGVAYDIMIKCHVLKE